MLGVNGAGKSTLVKILAGLVPPDSGAIRFGHNVTISYFGQHQAQELDSRYTVLETLSHVSNNLSVTQTRSLLGAFLFRGDDVDKKVGVLSGGEKSRVALAKMIATPANLLILDEPTNHLDIQSQEVLQEAMRQYDGSIIVVSHNRYFANSFVGKVLEIKGGHGTIFDGNIDYYLHKTHAEAASSLPKKAATPKIEPGSPAPEKQAKKGKDSRKLQADLRQQKNREIAPLKKIVDRSEQEIEQLEGRKTQLEQAMADPELYKDQDRFAELNNEYTSLGRKLKRTYADWEQAQAKMEEIETRFAGQCEE